MRGLLIAGFFFLAGAPSARGAGFVGSASCRACHQAAYDQWKVSPHAKALENLPPADQKNPQCLQCHARDQAQGGEAAVTCETCHGAGQYYWPDYVMRDSEVARGAGLTPSPDPRACALCHDNSTPSLKPFDPTTAMQAIDHWTKSRAARGVKSSDATAPKAAPVRQADARSAPSNESASERALAGRPTAPMAAKAAGAAANRAN